ncbi:MAG: thermonuclease family protein [Nakamurella sp.]
MIIARVGRAAIAAVLVGLSILVTSCTDSAATGSIEPSAVATGSAPTPSAKGTVGADTPGQLFPVLSVADGDTITVGIDGARQRIRLIGIDAPEVSGTPECFGDDASVYAKGILTGTSVGLVPDPTQDDQDRFGRLLRYVQLADGTDFGAQLIQLGYAQEYTYDKPYQRQDAYRTAESAAHSANRGLWSPVTCAAESAPDTPTAGPAVAPSAGAAPSTDSTPSAGNTAPTGCAIKGNINSKGEKIYHQPGDSSYPETVVTESKGERYFCSVADAVAAGWRAAKN